MTTLIDIFSALDFPGHSGTDNQFVAVGNWEENNAIRVGKQIVNVPSFVVRLDSQKHIDFALSSPFGGGRPGRVRRKKAKAAEKKDGGDDGDDDDEE